MLEIYKIWKFFTYLRTGHYFLNVTWERSCELIMKCHLDEGQNLSFMEISSNMRHLNLYE